MEHTQKDEAAIRALIDAFAGAIRARDIDGVMAVFAPEVVSFDLTPPLYHGGGEAFRRRWTAFFDTHAQTGTYAVTDLHIAVGGDTAFSHSLNRTQALPERWVRWTACYRRIEAAWRIVHEHVSVPVDPQHGRAVLDLTPGASAHENRAGN